MKTPGISDCFLHPHQVSDGTIALATRHTGRLLLLAAALAAGLTLLGSAQSDLRVAGQTAGPVATRTAPIVAGPENGGVSIAPQGSSSEATAALAAAAPGSGQPLALPPPNQLLSPEAASSTGQGNPGRGFPASALNLTAETGVSLIAGQSLVFVPPRAASCSATAELAYIPDQVNFTATCASGGAVNLSQPGVLCMQPSPQILASALGSLSNLSLASNSAIPSHPNPSGVLVCAAISSPGSYRLTVTGKTPPKAALHTLPKGIALQLPAVGLGGSAQP